VRLHRDVHEILTARCWVEAGPEDQRGIADLVPLEFGGSPGILIDRSGLREWEDFHLHATDSPAIPSVPACYLEVTGLDRLHQQCLLSGAEVTPPIERPLGRRDFVVEAPSGHLLAVGKRLAVPALH